ncbi:MAG: hypothetical protein KTR30_17095 [Saprospiraceae bacterium]|nr:hypothetical protein [Saprospiraceae bacterium]
MSELLTVELICSDFPSLPFEGRAVVFLGIQHKKDILEETPATAQEKTFTLQVKVSEGKDGSPNFTGPYVFGKTGDKFLYLVWFMKTPIGNEGFRRAKIKLQDLSWEQIRKAIADQSPIQAKISLTDAKGGPICASLKAPYINWTT